MSINIKVCDSTISLKRKGVSLAAYQIDKGRCSKFSIKLPTDEVDPEKRINHFKKKEDVTKKKERSRRKLKKFEKRYKYLESICYEYISPSGKPNQLPFRTNDSPPTNHSVCRLIELTQQVLQLEQKVNAILYSKSSRRFNDCKYMSFLLKLNKVKISLLDEFDLNLSDQILADNSHGYPTDDSRVISKLYENSNRCNVLSDNVTKKDEMSVVTESAPSRFVEDDHMMAKKIVNNLGVDDSNLMFDREINHSYKSKKTDTLSSTPIISDIPKVPPSFLKNTLLFKEKPPAYLKCKKYKRLNIDFTIHELSAIHEVTDCDISNSQMAIASRK